MTAAATPAETDFEAAAERAIVAGLGASTLDTYRQLVEFWGPGIAAMNAEDAMALSLNDSAIFRAAARKLWRERKPATVDSLDPAKGDL